MEIAEINLSHISYSECKGFFQPLSNKKKNWRDFGHILKQKRGAKGISIKSTTI